MKRLINLITLYLSESISKYLTDKLQEKILTSHIINKEFICRIYKEFLQMDKEYTIYSKSVEYIESVYRKWAKELAWQSQKRKFEWPVNMINYSNSLGIKEIKYYYVHMLYTQSA